MRDPDGDLLGTSSPQHQACKVCRACQASMRSVQLVYNLGSHMLSGVPLFTRNFKDGMITRRVSAKAGVFHAVPASAMNVFLEAQIARELHT